MADKQLENKRVIAHLKKLVRDLPIEVIGQIDAPALCCRSGTVAMVKIDRVSNPGPAVKASSRSSAKSAKKKSAR